MNINDTGNHYGPESKIQSLDTGGKPMPQSVRNFFEPRFGQNFGRVKLHDDAKAAEMARMVNARAFTIGSNIVFGSQRYAPHTEEGKRLLAHELTHVIQQNGRIGPDENRLQRSEDKEEWEGLKIDGDESFIKNVRSDLEKINRTKQGKELLEKIKTNRKPWYRNDIRIEPYSACGFFGYYDRLLYSPSTRCLDADRCGTGNSDWLNVGNYIYLFHELVHAYVYYIMDKEGHPEEECMVTGLGDYFDTMPFSENKLRCELGLPVRPCYNGECRKHSAPVCPSKQGDEGP